MKIIKPMGFSVSTDENRQPQKYSINDSVVYDYREQKCLEHCIGLDRMIKDLAGDPLVSVILPVRNGERYLLAALQSLVQQTFERFEVVIVDDGSTDCSVDIARSLSDPRIIITGNHDGQGICAALNTGVNHARGKYIARMDADDICHARRIERQLNFMEKNDAVGFCGSWTRRFNENSGDYCMDKKPSTPGRIRAFCIFDNPMVHSSVMIRKSALDHVGRPYREGYRHAEDYDLWTRLLGFTDGFNLSVSLLDYRVHDQSVTMEKSALMDQRAEAIARRELGRLKLFPSDVELSNHRRWSTGRFVSGDLIQELDHAENWFVGIMNVNRKVLLHDERDLMWCARRVWFALVYQAMSKGARVLKKYLNSPISREDPANLAVMLAASVKRSLCA